MRNFRVRHITRYEYELPVLQAQHLAHLRPRMLDTQRVHDFALSVVPPPAFLGSSSDYFGNATDRIEIAEVHDLLEVRSDVQVSVEAPNQERLQFSHQLGWEAWSERLRGDVELLPVREFCFDSPYVGPTRGLKEYAVRSFVPGRSASEALLELNQRIHSDFIYDPTATVASTPLFRVLRDRRGVCQDFAHFAIGCLRALGLAARYVSGYLETRPPPGSPRLVGADASHAWASAFLPEVGWFDIDPTNALAIEDRHVTLAWGRDFGDVTPLKGVVLGGGSQRVSVQVDVEPTG